MSEQNRGWLNRLPMVAEVEAHASIGGWWLRAYQRRTRLIRLIAELGRVRMVTDDTIGDAWHDDGIRWHPVTAEGLPVGWVDPETAHALRLDAYASEQNACEAVAHRTNAQREIVTLRSDLEASEAQVESLNARLARAEEERKSAVCGERAAEQEVERLSKKCDAHEKRIDELRSVMRSARILINFKDGDSMSHVKHGISCARDLLGEGHADDYGHSTDPDEYSNHLIKQIDGLHMAMAEAQSLLKIEDGTWIAEAQARIRRAAALLERRAVVPIRIPRNECDNAGMSLNDQATALQRRATDLEVNGQLHAAVKLRHAAELIVDAGGGPIAKAWQLMADMTEIRVYLDAKQGESTIDAVKRVNEYLASKVKLDKSICDYSLRELANDIERRARLSGEHGDRPAKLKLASGLLDDADGGIPSEAWERCYQDRHVRTFLIARDNERTIDAAKRVCWIGGPEAVRQVEQARERMNLSPGTTLLSEIDSLVNILRPVNGQRLSVAAIRKQDEINSVRRHVCAGPDEAILAAVLRRLDTARDDSATRNALGAMNGESTIQAAERVAASERVLSRTVKSVSDALRGIAPAQCNARRDDNPPDSGMPGG